MFAEDFLFNGQKLSDFKFRIGGDLDGDTIASGGEIDIVSVRPPASDTFDYYVGNLDSPIQYSFGIIKYNCADKNDIYVTPEEESRIAKWLMRKSYNSGYGWLQFDEDYYRDINYKVCFTEMMPMQVNGRTIGFNLTCVSNCGYGFSDEKKHRFRVSSGHKETIVISSDMETYIYPQIKISNGSGDFSFYNEKDNQSSTYFEDISSGTEFILDCENDMINGLYAINHFNWIFPRMVDGENVFGTNSANELYVELTYREPRRIIV